jgi:tetratricopeptide (TPR) repeat protein
LLRLRLAVLADDLPAVLAELPRTRSLYGGVPPVLQEVEEHLVYAYQRAAPGLSEAEFQAHRKVIVQQLLTRPEALSRTAAFALNRGVTLEELAAWSPGDSETIFRLGRFLQQIDWYAQAAPYYLQVAQIPPAAPEDEPRSHQAWMCYLEVCIRLQRFEELKQRLPAVLAEFKAHDFEQLDFLKNHVLPVLNDPAMQGIPLQNLREIFRMVPVFANPGVEAARLEVIGWISFRLEDFTDAKEVLGAARKLSPDPQILLGLGTIADKEADYTTAAHYYSDMLQLAPGNRVGILRRLARSYYLGGQNSNAAETYRLLMTVDPDHRLEYAARVGELSGADKKRR